MTSCTPIAKKRWSKTSSAKCRGQTGSLTSRGNAGDLVGGVLFRRHVKRAHEPAALVRRAPGFAETRTGVGLRQRISRHRMVELRQRRIIDVFVAADVISRRDCA